VCVCDVRLDLSPLTCPCMGGLPPVAAMSSALSLCMSTGARCLVAASAAATAVGRCACSLPPYAPPTRRRTTSTRAEGRDTAAATVA
jgi:hypothetical protein